ncbi:MAG: hypothetical protein ABII88_02780 [Candidatus Omnitrophota bacterium]
MKINRKNLILFVLIAAVIILWGIPKVHKVFNPEQYAQKKAIYLEKSIADLEHRIQQQQGKIELKNNELNEYKKNNTKDDEFPDMVKVKQDLIEILESIQANTRSVLKEKQAQLQEAQQMTGEKK